MRSFIVQMNGDIIDNEFNKYKEVMAMVVK